MLSGCKRLDKHASGKRLNNSMHPTFLYISHDFGSSKLLFRSGAEMYRLTRVQTNATEFGSSVPGLPIPQSVNVETEN